MTQIEHTPQPFFNNHYDIIGDDIGELVEKCLTRVRPQSRDFYAKGLRNDLKATGKSVISRHSAFGFSYSVKLMNKARQ